MSGAGLLVELEDFVDKHGARPPRGKKGSLGMRLHLFRKRKGNGKDDADVRKQIDAILCTVPKQWSSSLPKRRAMNKAKVHGKAHRLGSAQHRFEINQAAAARKRPASPGCASQPAGKVLKRPAQATLTDDRPCRPRGRRANPVDLRRLPDPVRDSGIPLTQPEVVNYLYSALQSVSDVLSEMGATWVATFGTALGCLRGGGMIPFDKDVDIAILVPSVPWPGWGRLAEYSRHKGHGFLPVSDCLAKVHAATAFVPSKYLEHWHRIAEDSKRRGLRMDMGQISAAAKRSVAEGHRIQHAGPHVIDIELLVRDAKNPNIVHGVELPKKFTIDRLLPVRKVAFGPLRVPVAAQAEWFLQQHYGEDWIVPKYQPLRGSALRKVPKSIPLAVFPT